MCGNDAHWILKTRKVKNGPVTYDYRGYNAEEMRNLRDRFLKPPSVYIDILSTVSVTVDRISMWWILRHLVDVEDECLWWR